MNQATKGPSKAVPRTSDFDMQGNRVEPSLPRIMLTVVLASIFVAYVATLWYPFVLDDVLQIVQNPFLNSWAQAPGYFGAAIWNKGWATAGGAASFYRPVLFIWLMLNRTLFGLHAFGWHLTAVLAHLGVTFLVYRLALKMSKDCWTALIAALIFGLHPVHVEAVSWISGATEPLLSLLFLGSFLAMIDYRERSQVRFLALSIGLFLVALFAKETALVLPVVVIAYEFIFDDGIPDPDRSSWVSRLSARCKIVVPYLAVTLFYIVVRRLVFSSFPSAVSTIPFKTMALTWPSVLEFYIKHLVWPANLSVFYDTAFVTKATFLKFWFPLLIVVVTTAVLVLIALYSRTQMVTFSLLWLLLTILPTLNFRVFQWREIAHDRYLYLPSVGFAMLLAVAIRRIPATRPRLLNAPALQSICVSLLGIILGVSTVGQSMVWASPLVLYSHAASVAPSNAGALYLLAGEFVARGRIEDGDAVYRRLVLVAPNWGLAWLQLGTLSFRTGDNTQAESQLLRATKLDTNNAAGFYWLGLSYEKSHKLQEAEAAFRHAIALDPSGEGFHLALGSVLKETGNSQAAAAEFQKELQYHPEAQLPHSKPHSSQSPGIQQ